MPGGPPVSRSAPKRSETRGERQSGHRSMMPKGSNALGRITPKHRPGSRCSRAYRGDHGHWLQEGGALGVVRPCPPPRAALISQRSRKMHPFSRPSDPSGRSGRRGAASRPGRVNLCEKDSFIYRWPESGRLTHMPPTSGRCSSHGASPVASCSSSHPGCGGPGMGASWTLPIRKKEYQ